MVEFDCDANDESEVLVGRDGKILVADGPSVLTAESALLFWQSVDLYGPCGAVALAPLLAKFGPGVTSPTPALDQ